MRNTKKLVALGLVCMMLTGCGGDGGTGQQGRAENTEAETEERVYGDLSNLNLSGVEETLALPEHLYKLKGATGGGWNEEKIYRDFPRAIEAYGGKKESELEPGEDIGCGTSVETENGWETEIVPLKDCPMEDIEWIQYETEDLFLEMSRIRQINTFQKGVVRELTGMKWDEWYLWEPRDTADPVITYDLSEDDITGVSYPIGGEELLLSEAVAFVEQAYTDEEAYPYMAHSEITYRVSEVEVYQYGENYGYYFVVTLAYKGVPIDDAAMGRPGKFNAPPGEDLIQYIEQVDRCLMLRRDDLAWSIRFDWIAEDWDSIEEIEATVGYEEALRMLSGYLSSNHEFQVLNARLAYNLYTETGPEFDEWANGTTWVEPHWVFELSTEGAQAYSNIYMLINVETGKIEEIYT